MSAEQGSGFVPPHPNRPRYGIRRNITWLAAASIAVKPIWLLFVVVFCWRYLGTVGYGIFSAALWLTHIPMSLTEIGLASFTTREVARARGEASTYFSNLVAFKLALAPVAWLTALLAALVLGYGHAEILAVAWAGLYAVGLSVTVYVRSFFQAMEDLRLEGISVIIEKVLVVTAGLFGLLAFRTPQATLAAMAAAMLCTAGLNVAWISRHLAAFRFDLIRWRFIRTALRTALPLGLASFFAVVYLRAGGVLLEHWHGEVVTGLFAGPFRILEALFLIIVVFAAAILPRLSNLFHNGEMDQFTNVFKRSAGAAVALAFVSALGISVFGDLVITLINPDPEAVGAIKILRLLIWLLPVITARELLVSALVASDQQVFLARGFALCLVASLVLNGLLTYPYGVDGVLMVFALTEVLILSICGYRYLRVVRPRKQTG